MKKQTSPDIASTSLWKWHMKWMSTSCSHVPEKPGIYVIGRVEYHCGLEISKEYIYVGKSKNLRRRLKEHGPADEKKVELQKYIQRHLGDLKCWFCEVPETQLNKREVFLIKSLCPCFNQVHNTKRKGDSNGS